MTGGFKVDILKQFLEDCKKKDGFGVKKGFLEIVMPVFEGSNLVSTFSSSFGKRFRKRGVRRTKRCKRRFDYKE